MLTVEQSLLPNAQRLAYRHWYWAPPVILVAVANVVGARVGVWRVV